MKHAHIFGTDYLFTQRKLPSKYAVIGMPHQMPAFAYLSDTYRDDLHRLEDCHAYRVFPSLKQAIAFLENPHGHKGYQAAHRLLERLIAWSVLEEINYWSE